MYLLWELHYLPIDEIVKSRAAYKIFFETIAYTFVSGILDVFSKNIKFHLTEIKIQKCLPDSWDIALGESFHVLVLISNFGQFSLLTSDSTFTLIHHTVCISNHTKWLQWMIPFHNIDIVEILTYISELCTT